MHDHSRFQRDINDVTGVSLSLSLSLYHSQKSLTHNIGSASALPIIKVCTFIQYFSKGVCVLQNDSAPNFSKIYPKRGKREKGGGEDTDHLSTGCG